MALITEQGKKQVAKIFDEKLASGIKLINFTQAGMPGAEVLQKCRYCDETEELLKEVSDFSTKIDLELHDFAAETDLAREYGVEKIPATILSSNGNKGVYFYGMPTGYEFTAFVDDIVDVSRGETDLSPGTKEKIRSIDKDVHIQVLTLPT